MSATPIASLLIDLHPSDVPGALAESAPARDGKEDAVEREAAIAKAIEKGRAEGLLQIEAELVRQRRELEAVHRHREEEMLSALRAEVSHHIDQALQHMVSSVGADIAQILKPFLLKRISEEAIDAILVEAQMILGEATGQISGIVRAPRAIVDILRPAFETSGRDFKIDVADQSDVQIKIGEAWLETRISNWLSNIEVSL